MITIKNPDKVHVDLSSPQGNAFALLGLAQSLGNRINKLLGEQYYDIEEIKNDMKSGNYEHFIEVLEANFGEYIIMYR
jgi:hypothetical protein